MTRVLVAGDSMVKYVDQYFPSRRGLSVSVAAHRGIRIEHLHSMIADKLASFDVVIVHVGTNNTVDSVNMCMDKYRQLAQGIIESNPTLHVAFSAILPRGQNRYRQGEEQLCDVCHFNDHYRNVNATLAQLCLERGFTILDSLVDSWPGFLSRDGVHPSRLGNKVLADFLHREAHLERRHPSREETHPTVLQGVQGICMEWVGSAGALFHQLGSRFSSTWSSTLWTHPVVKSSGSWMMLSSSS
ncbi:uncharacterized protein LOC119167570 isoform X1 [Rhipicephalus microplus]|uniref:uncharacterized protein LOC119167570 isoform X1 n=1 Tax=Rhipicephalus microplus TaxID=6941 RepID=UPI0018898316|nr:uncharacterized protein LOC119167570 isoform X1 [Rhipicephalus microplus]